MKMSERIEKMKEKFQSVSNRARGYVKRHKKRLSIITACVLLLVCSTGGFAYYNYNVVSNHTTVSTKEKNDTAKDVASKSDANKKNTSKDKKKEDLKTGSTPADSKSAVNTAGEMAEKTNVATSNKKADTGSSTAATSGSKNKNTGTSGNTGIGGTESGNTESGKTYHDPVYQTVYHDAEYQSVYVKDADAWTESVPVYSSTELCICNQCGADITNNIDAHLKAGMLNGTCSGYHSEWQQIQTGTQDVYHPEIGHNENQLVRDAWTEQVLVREGGYY